MRVTTSVTVPVSPANVNCPRPSVRDVTDIPSTRTSASLMGWRVMESLTMPRTEPVWAAATTGSPRSFRALSINTLSSRGRDCDALTRDIGGAPIQVRSRWSPEVQHDCIQLGVQRLYYPQPVPPQGSAEALPIACVTPSHLQCCFKPAPGSACLHNLPDTHQPLHPIRSSTTCLRFALTDNP